MPVSDADWHCFYGPLAPLLRRIGFRLRCNFVSLLMGDASRHQGIKMALHV